MATNKKYLSVRERSFYHRIEDVVGCKWSTAVIAAIDEGVRRPGELERFIPGISKKILNERLRKLTAFGLIERSEFPGTMPHVEYSLTPAGARLALLLEKLREVQELLDSPGGQQADSESCSGRAGEAGGGAG